MTAYILVKRDGEDTLHLDPAHEECNLDDTTNDMKFESDDLSAYLNDQHVRACNHCFGPATTVVGTDN